MGEITPAPIRLKSNPNALLQNLRSPIYLRVQMNSNMLTENNLSQNRQIQESCEWDVKLVTVQIETG